VKTALRTYHPVPSLQKTDGNAQDAPRIKNCLKAALLPSEFKSVPPSTPEEILKKTVSCVTLDRSSHNSLRIFQRSGQYPPTSVVNLIFVLSNHAAVSVSIYVWGAFNSLNYLTQPLANIHFDGTLNFLDLFLPKPLSSQDRARVFLWLMYYYLENPDGQNPFDDPYSRMNPGKAPQVRKLTKDEEAKENVDTLEEREWGALMSS
jgi:Ino eighty subunit 1